MNAYLKTVLVSVGGAAIGAAADMLAQQYASGRIDWHQVGVVALIAALTALKGLFIQSPITPKNK